MCWTKNFDMEQKKEKKAGIPYNGLSLRSIFRVMMETGYYPTYENGHILFDIDDNIGVVEYEEGIVSIRLFFTIDEEAYDLFVTASNAAMVESLIVKTVILDDMKSIMFSCESMCDTVREFKKFFPKMIEYIQEGIAVHKDEMRKLISTKEASATSLPAMEEGYEFNISGRNKLLS